MHKILLALLFSMGAIAAEVEQFTLKDGRVIIGTYDDSTQMMTSLSAGLAVSLHILPGQIESRQPADVPPAQAGDDRRVRPGRGNLACEQGRGGEEAQQTD